MQESVDKNHEVLDIGCGWGAFAIEIVKQIGCKYTGITLLKEQIVYAENKVKEAGLHGRIRFFLCDYRQFPNTFKYDRIISYEAIEHVGHEYYEEFFAAVNMLHVNTLITAMSESSSLALEWMDDWITFKQTYNKLSDQRKGLEMRFVGCLVGLESKVMRECYFVVGRDAWLRGLIGEMGNEGCEATCGDVEVSLISLEVLQGFSFFLQMGFTLILATFDGLDVGLLEDVIGENDCNDDDCDEEMSLVRMLVDGY
ncbi:mycolic acid cyclopropane synthase [Tanacetum coccineum]